MRIPPRLVSFCFAAAAVAHAHDPFSSVANATVGATGVELEVTMSVPTASDLFPGTPPILDEEHFASARPQLKQRALELYHISEGKISLTATAADASLSGENDLTFRLHYARSGAPGPLAFRAAYLAKMPAEHVGTLCVVDPAGNNLDWNYLDAAHPSLAVNLPAAPASPTEPTPRFAAFFRLGVSHILTGYDHLLFLGGLLVACRRFRAMAGIITCFTVAHSLTLAVAALGWVVLPSRVVEPLIAASIVFVGVENLLRRDAEPRGRWVLTFLFGLVHGFGFAGALREIGLGAGGSSLLVPLFSFNLGVETGQIAVAAVVLPLLLKLRSVPSFVRYGLPLASSVVTLLGSAWLLQRTVLA